MPSQIKRSFTRLTLADKWTQVSDIPENRQAFLRGTMVNYASDRARFDLAILAKAEDPIESVSFDADQTDWFLATHNGLTSGDVNQKNFDILPADITFGIAGNGDTVAIFDGVERTFVVRRDFELVPDKVQFFRLSGWIDLDRLATTGANASRLLVAAWPLDEEYEYASGDGSLAYKFNFFDGDENSRVYFEVGYTTSDVAVTGYNQLSFFTNVDLTIAKYMRFGGQINHNDGDGKMTLSPILIEELSPEQVASGFTGTARDYLLNNIKSATAQNVQPNAEIAIGSEIPLLLEAGDQVFIKSDQADTHISLFSTLETPS